MGKTWETKPQPKCPKVDPKRTHHLAGTGVNPLHEKKGSSIQELAGTSKGRKQPPPGYACGICGGAHWIYECPDKKDKKKKSAQQSPAKPAGALLGKSAQRRTASATLYVGNLAFKVKPDDLKAHFVGCAHVRLMKDEATGRSKGFAYVQYKTIAEAAAAYDSLNGSDINDRKIRLDYTKNKPRDKDSIAERGEQPEKAAKPTGGPGKVFASGLPFGCSEEDVFKLFESCGDIKAVKLNTFKGKKKCNGQAYITFKNHKQADKAVKKITDKKPEGAAESDGEAKKGRWIEVVHAKDRVKPVKGPKVVPLREAMDKLDKADTGAGSKKKKRAAAADDEGGEDGDEAAREKKKRLLREKKNLKKKVAKKRDADAAPASDPAPEPAAADDAAGDAGETSDTKDTKKEKKSKKEKKEKKSKKEKTGKRKKDEAGEAEAEVESAAESPPKKVKKKKSKKAAKAADDA